MSFQQKTKIGLSTKFFGHRKKVPLSPRGCLGERLSVQTCPPWGARGQPGEKN
jgi:hypothetical protein